MDYNFGYCVLWFLSNPFLIKAVFMVCLSLGFLVGVLRFAG